VLEEHLSYVSDERKIAVFKRAIDAVITGSSVVADVGCGVGVLGLLCLQAGAQRIYGIDSTAILDVAQRSFEQAGLASKVRFIRGNSRSVALPEPVDLIVCDHVGYFGFDYDIVHLLQDARRRFLKPGGKIIPSHLRLMIGVGQSESHRAKYDDWRSSRVPCEFAWVRTLAVNAKHKAFLNREDILSEPAILGEIDLTVENPDFFSWSADVTIARDSTAHGLAGWFDCTLAPGVTMTNSPLSSDAIRRPQAFLPIERAVAVKAGDSVKVTVMCRPADSVLSWTAEFPRTGDRLSHSTWQGMLVAPQDLMRSHASRIPRISRDGMARQKVLGLCDGLRTAKEIEEQVQRDFPALFPSLDEIARFVAQTLAENTE
jgi:SAM-dependent methyltransferase